MYKHLSLNEASKDLDNKRRDYLIQQLPRNCLTNTLAGSSYLGHDEHGNTVIRHCNCKQLNCRTCARSRLRELYDAVSAQAFTHYLVLTLPGNVQHNDCERKLKQALARFFQEAKRIPGSQRLSYFWCLGIDLRPNARLHVNILLNTDFSSATRYRKPVLNWAKDTWRRLTGAHQVSLQHITSGTLGGVVNYILSDMLKTVIKRPSIHRRLSSSRGIPLKIKRKHISDGSTWGRLPLTTTACATALGISHSMPGNGTLTLPAATGLDALSKLLNNPDAAPAAPLPTPEVPALDGGTPTGGTSVPAAGTEALGAQQQQLGGTHGL
jgi:hypothetical protein